MQVTQACAVAGVADLADGRALLDPGRGSHGGHSRRYTIHDVHVPIVLQTPTPDGHRNDDVATIFPVVDDHGPGARRPHPLPTLTIDIDVDPAVHTISLAEIGIYIAGEHLVVVSHPRTNWPGRRHAAVFQAL